MFSRFPEIMTVKDLSEALRISLIKAYGLVHSGVIPSFKIANITRIPKKALLEYVCGSDYNLYEADTRPDQEGGSKQK